MLNKNNSGYTGGTGGIANALVAAMAGLSAATNAACESLAEYAAPRESDYGDGINTAVIPALQRRAKAHRRKRSRRVR